MDTHVHTSSCSNSYHMWYICINLCTCSDTLTHTLYPMCSGLGVQIRDQGQHWDYTVLSSPASTIDQKLALSSTMVMLHTHIGKYIHSLIPNQYQQNALASEDFNCLSVPSPHIIFYIFLRLFLYLALSHHCTILKSPSQHYQLPPASLTLIKAPFQMSHCLTFFLTWSIPWTCLDVLPSPTETADKLQVEMSTQGQSNQEMNHPTELRFVTHLGEEKGS